jgi:hypothetical protein
VKRTTTLEQLLTIAFLTLGTVITSPAALAQPSSAQTADCDRQCLSQVMDRFLAAMVAGKSDAVRLSADAEVRQNTRLVPLAQTAWKDVKAIKSTMMFADPVTANVVARAGVELKNGRPAYLSTRLRVLPSGTITDVELSADTSSRVVATYVYALDPHYSEILPAEQRMSRDSLEALGRRYFIGLTDHHPVAEDYDDRCDRYHSGQRVTNASSNSVEGGPPRTCFGSNNGDRPWGPAIEQRFPIVDPERGIVLGLTLLLYPKSPSQQRMYVSEIFKVVNHKIVQIDNIGLMLQGVTTNGYVH